MPVYVFNLSTSAGFSSSHAQVTSIETKSALWIHLLYHLLSLTKTLEEWSMVADTHKSILFSL